MKVFIGGSIGINYLDYTVTDELDKYLQGDLEILIGDAYGIDSLVQKYLAEYGYDNVTVYASNGRARNNISGWKVKAIEVPSFIHGREFYTQKDIAMTNDCDFAFMIWKKSGKDNGIKILSAMENIPDTPEGILLESLLERFAHTNGHNNIIKSFSILLNCATIQYDNNKTPGGILPSGVCFLTFTAF